MESQKVVLIYSSNLSLQKSPTANFYNVDAGVANNRDHRLHGGFWRNEHDKQQIEQYNRRSVAQWRHCDVSPATIIATTNTTTVFIFVAIVASKRHTATAIPTTKGVQFNSTK